MMKDDSSAKGWDREYESGRYQGEGPVAFVDDIVAHAKRAQLSSGLYIGCGNGRNYLPLIRSGLDLQGLDISCVAIRQLESIVPELRYRLVVGDISSLPPTSQYQLVVAIQVFQHGRRADTHAHIRAAQDLVAPGGLIAVRVNAAGTDVVLAHDVSEKDPVGGFTVRYLEGAKQGLDIHFFSETELARLFDVTFVPVLALRLDVTRREPPATGQWSQWEGIWRRPTPPRRSASSRRSAIVIRRSRPRSNATHLTAARSYFSGASSRTSRTRLSASARSMWRSSAAATSAFPVLRARWNWAYACPGDVTAIEHTFAGWRPWVNPARGYT
jgi:SAM-dependent methyltransferase